MAENLMDIDLTRLPQHIAIIMDGNGRWAKIRGRERSFGHQAGAQTVHDIVEEAARIGIRYLTLYTFSTENWSRPSDEVAGIMDLLVKRIEEDTLMKNNVRFRTIGDLDRLPEYVQDSMRHCMEITAKNTGLTMVLALSYSSEWELTKAVKEIATSVKNGELATEEISGETIANHLDTRFMPNPDLLIRTGGEVRLSNFMLLQCAYSELYFCDTYWPDFDAEALHKAIASYQNRERRYGKTSEQLS